MFMLATDHNPKHHFLESAIGRLSHQEYRFRTRLSAGQNLGQSELTSIKSLTKRYEQLLQLLWTHRIKYFVGHHLQA